MKKLSKSVLLLSGIAAGSLLLTACHENPFKAHSERENVVALQDAARASEKDLGIDPARRGRTFLDCMNKKSTTVDCPKFFEHMLSAIQAKDDYKDMRLSDLTDKESFLSLADAYEDKIFNTADY